MDRENALTLLERLGCNRIRPYGSEITASCPFMENHWRGDRFPSFSSKINDSDSSPYFCFSCQEKGTLEGLAIKTGNEDLVPDWKPKKLKPSDWMPIPKTNAKFFAHLYAEREPVFFDDELLKDFARALSGSIRDRGVTVDTAKHWELMVDHEYGRAIFVLRDIEGRIAVVIGRDTTGCSRVKYSNYVLDRKYDCLVPFKDRKREEDFLGPAKSFFLYGEKQAWEVRNLEARRNPHDLVVVEGAMDVLKVWQYGWNVVGILGSYASDEQAEKLVSLVPRDGCLISLMDSDKAGRMCADKLGEKVHERIPFYTAELEDGLDPGEASVELIDAAMKKKKRYKLTVKN